jgi:hypothetical protein
MEKKVIHEVRLSKPLMAVAIIGAVGLFAIGVKPLLSTPANAVGGVQKMAVCTADGSLCADLGRSGRIKIHNSGN